MEDRRMSQAWLALRLAFGVVPVVAGLDKFFNLLTNWEQYLNPFARRLLPVSDVAFMRAAGVIEIVVGLMILTRWTRLGAYIASAWLALIAINLLATAHYFDIAARDGALAVGAFALARLQEVRSGAHQGVTAAVSSAPIHSPAHV
jgi:uncharacterized membrane protein YphA (DoxX/SURF4 family)